MDRCKNQTAIITGASSGIGAAIAKHLAGEGADVVLAARNQDQLGAVAGEINEQGNGRALAVATDVSKQADVDAMVKQAKETFGAADIYVNNAGAMLNAQIRDGEVAAWEQMIDVNIKGMLYGVHAVLPKMLEKSSGHVVNIASVSGLEVTKVSTVYSATKYAVRAVSMGMEKELARTGVRVTNISPGMVDTSLGTDESSERESQRFGDRRPLEASDIAQSVVYAVTQPDYVNVNEITVRPV